MKALDTNILLYAHRREFPFHKQAKALLQGLSEGSQPWAIPAPCFYEFLRVATHPSVFNPPTPLIEARENIHSLLKSPSLIVLYPTNRHWEILDRVLASSKVRGNLIFDAQIATLLLEHGISEILTADRDFHRFKELKVHHPFEEA